MIGFVLFGLVCMRLPELKVDNLHFNFMCSISSSEVPTPFEGRPRATELQSSGALRAAPRTGASFAWTRSDGSR